MKKTGGFLVFSVSLLFLFSSCGQNPLAENINRAIQDWEPSSQSSKESQIDTYTNPDFSSSLEFNVATYPNDNNLKPTKFFAIDRWFAQVEYDTVEGQIFVLRIARVGNGVLSSTYSETHAQSVEKLEIDGIPIENRKSSSGCSMLVWEKNGYQYIIHSKNGQTAPSSQEIERFVKELNTVKSEATGSIAK